MEVINSRSSLLTNTEVYHISEEIQQFQQQTNKSDRLKNLRTLLYETKQYLQDKPAVVQTPDTIKDLALATEQFKLTKAEFLQILNLRPTSQVEIQLIVEECEERLSEEQVEKLLEIIKNVLPDPKTVTGQNEPMEQD